MQCARESCAAPARWYPVLLLFAPRRLFPHAPPARGICGVPVCDGHRDTVTLEDLLTDEGWLRIVTGFHAARKAIPDRRDTRLEFIAIDSAEARAFRRGVEP